MCNTYIFLKNDPNTGEDLYCNAIWSRRLTLTPTLTLNHFPLTLKPYLTDF